MTVNKSALAALVFQRVSGVGDRVVDPVALGQGTALLDQQRKHQGNEPHRRYRPDTPGRAPCFVMIRSRRSHWLVHRIALGHQQAVQIAQHRCGRSPDEELPSP